MASLNTDKNHHRLLLVEDEPTAMAALRKFFSCAGYEVDAARELEEAEAMIATTHFDVVIADLRLSWSYAVEGLEILRFVLHHSRGTKVVILSAHGSPEIQRSARALGAGAFLQKPAPLPEIGAAVKRLMEQA